MSKEDLAKLPKEVSITKLLEECKSVGVDVHKVFAYALSEQALKEDSGITRRWQGEHAWKVIDKAEPSQQAVKHSGDAEEPVIIRYSSDDEKL